MRVIQCHSEPRRQCHSEPRRRRGIWAGIAAIVFASCLSLGVLAQEAPSDKPSTEDLVKRAAEAKAKRKKSSTKVITNKDVKKSKGKLIELPPKAQTPLPKITTVPTAAQQDASYHDRQAADERVSQAQKKVTDLQKALDDVEQQYYEENDPDYRDNVLQKRFKQTRHQLEEARQQLADARDTVLKLSASNQK